MLPDTRFLRTFLIVCEEGKFSRAARRLHLTQPAVSYQMDRLEQRFGVELFERAGRRMILTPAGRRLHEFCARYFGELDSLVAELSQESAASAEPLRIAAVSGFGRYVLFPLLAGEGFTGLRLDLTYETADAVFDRVEAGEVDLGVVYRTKVSNYLEFSELQKEELVLIAAPDRMAADEPSELADLDGLPFITYEESDYVFGKWFDAFFGAQPRITRSVHHFEELEEVVAMVARDRGVSIVPDHSAAFGIGAGKLVVVRPGGTRCWNTVHAVTRAGAFVRPVVERIIETLGGRGRHG